MGLTRRRLLALAGVSTLSAAMAGAVRAEGGSVALAPAAPVAPAAVPPSFALTTPMRVGAVALRVRHLAPMVLWYRTTFGFDVISRTGRQAVLGADGVGLLHLVGAPDAPPDRPESAGLFHIAFLMPDREALARWLVHAAGTGVRLDGFADHSVSEAVYLSDPEGNGLEVYADRPRDTWLWRDGVVTMGTFDLDIDGLLTLTDTSRDTYAGVPAGTRIGHVHLRVGDIPAGRTFYESGLGLASTRGLRTDSAFLSSGGYHHHVALNIWQSAGAPPRDPEAAGLMWFTLEVADPALMAAMTTRLPKAQQTASGTLAATDPWGTEVRIIAA
ncbi:VOC family protein [Segnochrobactraceae bacterium EtOH-i3]